ncbi:hypothetical protein BaRGS_00005986 [Batillaria attramentaria]|uniref:Uncharacterized protein n=1 Tax=Batillaria attramentaria TaxID=370345 RepID=A0ABD0LTB4_9CAEN
MLSCRCGLVCSTDYSSIRGGWNSLSHWQWKPADGLINIAGKAGPRALSGCSSAEALDQTMLGIETNESDGVQRLRAMECSAYEVWSVATVRYGV